MATTTKKTTTPATPITEALEAMKAIEPKLPSAKVKTSIITVTYQLDTIKKFLALVPNSGIARKKLRTAQWCVENGTNVVPFSVIEKIHTELKAQGLCGESDQANKHVTKLAKAGLVTITTNSETVNQAEIDEAKKAIKALKALDV